jgi:C4-dicarboxylate transporter DctM subunit
MVRLGRGFGWLISGLNSAGTGWIFVMMVLINADVLSRALFNLPISGVPLVISLSIIAVVFLQLPDALRNGRMTRNEVVLSRLEAKGSPWAHILHAVFHLAGLATMVVVCVYGYPLLVKAWETGAYYGNLGDFTFAEWPIKLVVLIGAASCGIQFLLNAAKDVRALSDVGGRPALAKLAIVVAGAIAAIFALRYGLASMSAVNVGFLSVLFMLVLVYLGLHVGIALAIVAFFCVLIIRDSGSLSGTMLALAANESLRQYELGVIPLFVLMGMFVAISDVGKDAFAVADQLFRRLRGGLGTATVIANAIFAAITGTSIASASVFTKIAVPEMLNAGYKSRFAVGVVAGSSVLGMLIPPSLLMIIFGILAETSIGDLFIAGIIPGIVLSLAYSILIWIMATRFPRSVYASGSAPMLGPRRAAVDRLESAKPGMSGAEMLLRIGPIMGLIVLILAGIYGGIFTATEAGGVGAALAGLIALVRRKLTLASLWRVLVETGYVTASICFLLVAAHLYARMISVSGIPGTLEHGISAAGLGYWGLIAAYLVVIIILGTILDAGSIMLITVPIVVPTMIAMQAAGVDIGSMVWFGIITVIAVEIGLLTPPVGLACFAIHSNLNDRRISLNDVFWGAAPFAAVMVIVLLLVVAFPWLALALL